MPVFPVFLDLRGRRCLVVGGGTVGCDKARSLAAAGAEVLVVDPSPAPGLLAELSSGPDEELTGEPGSGVSGRNAAPGRITVEARAFGPEDCDGRVLVFACTDDAHVNEAVVAAAAGRHVLVCRAGAGGHPRASAPEGQGDSRHDDAGRQATFTTGAIVRRGELCVAISSGGASPALAAAARDRIAADIGDEFGEAAVLLSALRKRLQADIVDATTRHEALRGVIADGLLELLRERRRSDAAALVDDAFERACRSAARDREGTRCTR